MKQQYIIEIKPGVYYIEKAKNVLTGNIQSYDLTDNIDLATKYDSYEDDLLSKAKQVFGYIKIYKEEKEKRIRDLHDEMDKAYKNMKMFERLFNQWNDELVRLDEELMKIDKP